MFGSLVIASIGFVVVTWIAFKEMNINEELHRDNRQLRKTVAKLQKRIDRINDITCEENKEEGNPPS